MTVGTRPYEGLRVALAHDWLTGQRGGEKVLDELCLMFPEAPIHTLFHFPGTVSETIESHEIRTSFLQRAPALEQWYRHYLPLFPRAIESFDLADFDLVVSTSHCVAKGLRVREGAVHVCYCHTPMRYAWDQRHVYFPPGGPLGRPRGWILDRLQRWDVRTSDRVHTYVANSSFVADRIERYYDRAADVVPPPVDLDFFVPATEGVPPAEPYALMVAALSPYKRSDLAIAACRRLGLELRIVGTGPEHDRLAKLPGRPRLLGRVSARELRSLYQGAACFVQPGIEDFGIASVEALACGCPVVAADRGGVRDIVRDDREGVLYSDDDDDDEAESLTAAIDKTLEMQFDKLDLRQRAERFSSSEFPVRMHSVIMRSLRSAGVDV